MVDQMYDRKTGVKSSVSEDVTSLIPASPHGRLPQLVPQPAPPTHLRGRTGNKVKSITRTSELDAYEQELEAWLAVHANQAHVMATTEILKSSTRALSSFTYIARTQAIDLDSQDLQTFFQIRAYLSGGLITQAHLSQLQLGERLLEISARDLDRSYSPGAFVEQIEYVIGSK